jgi:hypothetical protein
VSRTFVGSCIRHFFFDGSVQIAAECVLIFRQQVEKLKSVTDLKVSCDDNSLRMHGVADPKACLQYRPYGECKHHFQVTASKTEIGSCTCESSSALGTKLNWHPRLESRILSAILFGERNGRVTFDCVRGCLKEQWDRASVSGEGRFSTQLTPISFSRTVATLHAAKGERLWR